MALLDDEIRRSGLPAGLSDEHRERLAVLAHGQASRVCHFDLHPETIIVTDQRWVVIDWLTATNGPPITDYARTLLLHADATEPVIKTFIAAIQRHAHDRRGFDDDTVAPWTPIVAAARLAEGFNWPYADWLTTIATTTQ